MSGRIRNEETLPPRFPEEPEAQAQAPDPQPAPEPQPQPPPQQPDQNGDEEARPHGAPENWKDRIARETRQRYEALREAAQWRRQAEEMQARAQGQQPQNDAREQAKREIREEARLEAFNEACNRTFEQGKAHYPTFDDDVASLSAVGKAQPNPQAWQDFLEAVSSLEDGDAVYHQLAQDLPAAERIMRLGRIAMATRVASMAHELRGRRNGRETIEETHVTGEHMNPLVSRAPPPVRSVGGQTAPRPLSLDKMPMRDFIRQRDAEEWERRRGG